MMRKRLLALVAIAAILSGCGEKNTGDVKKESIFPLTGKIVKMLKGTTIQAEMKIFGKLVTIEIDRDAKVTFDGKPSTVNALTDGQTIYAESADGAKAHSIAITDWPGLDKVGQAVKMSPEAAFNFAIDYISNSHPNSKIPKKASWSMAGKTEKLSNGLLLASFRAGKHSARVTWIAGEGAEGYDLSVFADGLQMSLWSGRVRKDGKVVEDRYDEK